MSQVQICETEHSKEKLSSLGKSFSLQSPGFDFQAAFHGPGDLELVMNCWMSAFMNLSTEIKSSSYLRPGV